MSAPCRGIPWRAISSRKMRCLNAMLGSVFERLAPRPALHRVHLTQQRHSFLEAIMPCKNLWPEHAQHDAERTWASAVTGGVATPSCVQPRVSCGAWLRHCWTRGCQHLRKSAPKLAWASPPWALREAANRPADPSRCRCRSIELYYNCKRSPSRRATVRSELGRAACSANGLEEPVDKFADMRGVRMQ